jgi:hypothetical protein
MDAFDMMFDENEFDLSQIEPNEPERDQHNSENVENVQNNTET